MIKFKNIITFDLLLIYIVGIWYKIISNNLKPKNLEILMSFAIFAYFDNFRNLESFNSISQIIESNIKKYKTEKHTVSSK